MGKQRASKEMVLFFEQAKATPEESEKRVDDAFDILFEETLKFLSIQKHNQEAPLIFTNQSLKGGEKHERRYVS
ncbi:hypothetical protein A3C23_04610 [Candidatus Roizmanbacteria bacterium RIFCSPHIGHO2_02_FULL_37_13b]|uniref:Uncharacterized protein n=1 Tax=Candidatus Roizmanbacteria bacterium RIFCSPLOWO2_02_FULL_36_11 TaxID=1802071 RepID=A0A1F7JHA3_9BACT|nr:MAG: hypothetical protein A3C23_04610 [Candidatus Roizmanbacteria bacterium RIFCSPHIGHO2_02_FULL_37_13b]OGK54990.1 MAG: hypothetical protein A3H78_00755 [Candidatus Roizmanbacteria bacterium RIFCSPLOWO2_02_FULL_36_11]